MNWIIDNREWLFGGIAVAVPLAIVGWLISNRGNKQFQKSGKNSTNIQIGGNMKTVDEKDDD